MTGRERNKWKNIIRILTIGFKGFTVSLFKGFQLRSYLAWNVNFSATSSLMSRSLFFVVYNKTKL